MGLIQRQYVSSAQIQSADITDISVALEDRKDDSPTVEVTPYDGLVGYVKERFQRAELARRIDELRWMKAYRNFRGLYGSDVQFTETEKSRAFIKITKMKVMAAYAQLCDVLFSGNRFPIGIEPSRIPEGIVEAVHLDPQEPQDYKADTDDDGDSPDQPPMPGQHMNVYGFPGDGNDPQPGATLKDLLGPLDEELGELPIKEGPGLTPTSVSFYPSEVAAKKMQKKIADQLDESNASKHLRFCALESVMLGTGIIKGPLAFQKDYPRWEDDGTFAPKSKTIPRMEAVSCWNIFPDPDATNSDEMEYVVERHKLNRSQLRALKKRPLFRANAIESAINLGTNYTKLWWENELHDNKDNFTVQRWEVFEYWGIVDKAIAADAGLEIPKDFDDADQVQVNVWICNNQLIRLVLNPFTPNRIPYQIVPYEFHPYSIFGVGVPENMEDTQGLMNGFMRMAVDNGVLSGNVILEVDETLLVPGQDSALYPGKVFRRQGGPVGQSIHAIEIPNVTQQNLQLFDKARQLADEATGIPSFSHGQTGVQGTGRTAAGISMLMNAASDGIKSVVKNFDDYLLRPLGEAYYFFNQQFDFDPDLNEELEVRALGTEALMKSEVRTQRLMTLLQVLANPAMAPYAKWPYILRQIAEAMDLDPDKFVNSPEEAFAQAMLMQMHGMLGNNQGGSGGGVAGANPTDPTGAGGGNIGTTGAPPQPGAPGFAANKSPQPAQGGAQ